MTKFRHTRQKQRQYLIKKFAKHLKKLRKAHDFSQEELAFRSGLSRTHIGNLEQGVYMPTLLVEWRIAQALKMSLPEFWQGFDAEKASLRTET